jgi:hypothetical protein
MAGGDLDGDQYWVYWGDEFEIKNVVPPLLYPAAKKSSGVRVTNDLIVDHALDTFIDNVPGIIANTHKVIADQHPLGTLSEECKECARLFARAIDARKTGEKIDRDRIKQIRDKYCQTYPTWMMKFDKPQMDPPSASINEILYRKAQEAWIHQDNFQDILRPLPGIELPVAIEIDDTNQAPEGSETEEKNRYCCKTFCMLIYVVVVLIIAYVLVRKYILHK